MGYFTDTMAVILLLIMSSWNGHVHVSLFLLHTDLKQPYCAFEMWSGGWRVFICSTFEKYMSRKWWYCVVLCRMTMDGIVESFQMLGSVLHKSKIQEPVFLLNQAWFALSRNINGPDNILVLQKFQYSVWRSFSLACRECTQNCIDCIFLWNKFQPLQ
jgi:hypothetical protein